MLAAWSGVMIISDVVDLYRRDVLVPVAIGAAFLIAGIVLILRDARKKAGL